MKRELSILSIFIALFILHPTRLKAQIQLIPTTIVLDRAGVGTVIVINTSEEPREISILTEFRYNVSDDRGFSVDAEDYSELEEYNISESLLIYPSRFFLGAGERRDIRVQHRMGPDMKDGGYFSRFIVKAEPMARDAVKEENPEMISVQLNYVLIQDIPLYHFYGDATTGFNITDFTIAEPVDEPESFIFVFDMDKTGNAPYRGSVEIVITDEEGEIIEELTRQVALFTDRKIGLKMDKQLYAPGVEYQADFTFKTRRSSNSPDQLVQAPNVNYLSAFSIQDK